MKSIRCATVGLSALLVSVVAAAQQPSAKQPLTWTAAAVRPATPPTVLLDIQPQPMEQALQAFAAQSGLQVIFPTELTQAITSPGLKGTYTPEIALSKLLANTELRFEYVNERTVAIRSANASAAETSQPPTGSLMGRGASERPFRLAQADQRAYSVESGRDRASSRENENKTIALEEIVVTGTHIRGVRPSSPVVTITQEEMRLSGHNDLGEVIRALPQSFSGGQNPGVALGAISAGSANLNLSGASSLNLRGLGPDATLTLLNGSRLPYDGTSQATDVSVIPVAAIERVEILLDGASALYGSDAVGGVANIILKRDYQGAEVSARYGVATDGGNEQVQYTGVGGATWGSGAFLASFDIDRNTAVEARHRDYLAHMPERNADVFPEITQKGALVSGHQALGASAELGLDAFYTDRELSQLFSIQTAYEDVRVESTSWGVSPALRVGLPNEWSARVNAFVGRNETTRTTPRFSRATGARTALSRTFYPNKSEAVGVEAEGALFTLPGGHARISVGAGYRKSSLEVINLVAATTSDSGSNRSRYGFGEIHLPLISEDHGVRAVSRLSFNGAVRYEKYNNFGDVTTPKLGVVWGVTPDLDLKVSWGKSFKVPTLRERYGDRFLTLFPLAGFGSSVPAGAPTDPNAAVVIATGGNLDLDPERAEVLTAGLAVRPRLLPGFTLELGWFYIDYSDRVVAPVSPLTQALINPAFAQLVTIDPTIAEQDAIFAAAGLPVGTFTGNFTGGDYDPASVFAIVDSRQVNAAQQRAEGIDLSTDYTSDVLGGSLTASANATWLDGHRSLTSLSPQLATAGVIYFPPKFRGRAGLAWSRKGFTLAAHVNHIGGVKNTNITPNPKGASMTTVDMVIDYQADLGLVGDVGFDLVVTNLFDDAPPFLQPSQFYFVNYDSTNYSPIGRVVSAMITKRF